MAEDSDADKTEEPSERRLEQAREKGQVPQSRELSTFLVLITASAIMWGLGDYFTMKFAHVVRHALTPDLKIMKETNLLLPRLAEITGDAFFIFLPLILALFVVALLPPLLLNSWVFSTQALIPDIKKINPITGIGRMFSLHSLVELVKAILKTILLGGVAVLMVWLYIDELFQLSVMPLHTAMSIAGGILLKCFVALVSTLLLVVSLDVPFQIWQHFDKLKMTKDEVKQEYKEMMGNPEIKGRIRSLQMQAARRRMMNAVPEADVVVTNPTHFAVAMNYKEGMVAPKVVAKGKGNIAAKIKEIAAEHSVPTLEAPPLARSLYKFADLDKELPTKLYAAVAEVLAYVYRLSTWKKEGGSYPLPPKDLPIPKEIYVEET